MKGLILSSVLLLVLFTSRVNGLSCIPCGEYPCPKAECDISGYTLGVCGCCTVCARAVNQTCGGDFNIQGTCDKNLTCSGYTPFSGFGGNCSDHYCLARVDFTFLLEGSRSFGEMGFRNATIWSRKVTERIYERYGACARVAIAEYGGVLSERRLEYPVNISQCTNNNDCVERKLANYTFFNLSGIETFSALNNVLQTLGNNSRGADSKKVIILVTWGGTTDSSLSEDWLRTSSGMAITYASKVGATWEELVSITGNISRVIDPVDIDDFINQIWGDTVNMNGTSRCSIGEKYTECSTMCEPTCSDPTPMCIEICGPPSCQCVEGYFRHEGSCIPESACPVTVECPEGEEFFGCSSYCESTCENPTPICIDLCGPPACQCKHGYARLNGTCIPSEHCPSVECPDGEEFLECSSYCESTCEDPMPICIALCGPPACQCKHGYARSNGTCVPFENCPSEAGKCNFNCPMMNMTASGQQLAMTWMCHLKNWRCLLYDWRLSIEEWWNNNECYYADNSMEKRWWELFECPEFVEITCRDKSQYVYEEDAFGCGMPRCIDGRYKNSSQLIKMWTLHQMKYQQKLQLYKEAVQICREWHEN